MSCSNYYPYDKRLLIDRLAVASNMNYVIDVPDFDRTIERAREAISLRAALKPPRREPTVLRSQVVGARVDRRIIPPSRFAFYQGNF